MAKFIEVTDRGDEKRVLINTDKIISVQEQENGLAYVEVQLTDDCEMGYGVPCIEAYTFVANLLALSESGKAVQDE